MLLKRSRLILRQQVDPPQPGVDAVGEGEVNDPVAAAERDRRLGAVFRQRHQAAAGAACEDKDEGVPELERDHEWSSAEAGGPDMRMHVGGAAGRRGSCFLGGKMPFNKLGNVTFPFFYQLVIQRAIGVM